MGPTICKKVHDGGKLIYRLDRQGGIRLKSGEGTLLLEGYKPSPSHDGSFELLREERSAC